MQLNPHYAELNESYLFSTIAHKVADYQKAHPEADVIRLGIGDVTLPLAASVTEAMHKAVEEQGHKGTFHGYIPSEQGYEFLRDAIRRYYAGHGVELDMSEIFISDGAKSDLGNLLDLFSQDNTILVPDPVYPVYVDSNVMAGRTGSYDPLTERWAFLSGPERRRKPAVYSKLMSAWGFTGYLCPLVGESTLNVDCPAVFLPVTIAHELAHQRGVAPEQEANFVGVMAATASGRAAYRYSGWLFGYLHLSNALYTADPARAAESYRLLCAEAQADLAANNAYWKQWEGPVRETGEKVYTTFLQGYGQTLGMRSYGACVDLLVEEFLPNTTAGD